MITRWLDTVSRWWTYSRVANGMGGRTLLLERFAGIQYSGLAGISQACMDAVLRLIQFGDEVKHVRILTSGDTHCLLLTINPGDDLVAVKSGFRHGYGGEGPRTFSQTLALLSAYEIEVDEHDVSDELIERLDASALTRADVDQIRTGRSVRPGRWYEYIDERDWEARRFGKEHLWREFPPVIPFAIIDLRIMDLALTFWKEPDSKLVTAYRRLEDTVRIRTGSKEHGTKLFSQAFSGATSKLYWVEVQDPGEQAGRANLFVGAYGAHRNPRAHREPNESPYTQLTEFLVVNHLYRLESEAVDRSLSAGSD